MEEVREAWTDFLSKYPLDSFLTVTFREPRQHYQSIQVLASVKAVAERAVTVRHGFLGIEEHRSQYTHLHGLLLHGAPAPGQMGRSLRSRQTDIWERMFHGFGRSQVVSPETIGGVVGYVSKYVMKGLADYDFW